MNTDLETIEKWERHIHDGLMRTVHYHRQPLMEVEEFARLAGHYLLTGIQRQARDEQHRTELTAAAKRGLLAGFTQTAHQREEQ